MALPYIAAGVILLLRAIDEKKRTKNLSIFGPFGLMSFLFGSAIFVSVVLEVL
jgi:hypothetical protein